MLHNAFESIATEATLQTIAQKEVGFLERIALKVLSKFIFTSGGLRVDASSTSIGVGTVSTVNASNNVALGRFSTDGMSIQQTQLNYGNTFRRNLTIS